MGVFISGYGKMGKMVEEELLSKQLECVGYSDDITSVNKDLAKESVCIDFTTPDAFIANYKFLADNFKAVVVGTTGWYHIKDEVFSYFKEKATPLIWGSNFSIGVIALHAAVAKVAEIVKSTNAYTPYIEEKHHCHKKDAPSGTAQTLANEVVKAMNATPQIVSIRAGEIHGIHTVTFEGKCDRITLMHEAFSRKGFAEGAVIASQLILNLKGIYEFKDLIK